MVAKKKLQHAVLNSAQAGLTLILYYVSLLPKGRFVVSAL